MCNTFLGMHVSVLHVGCEGHVDHCGFSSYGDHGWCLCSGTVQRLNLVNIGLWI